MVSNKKIPLMVPSLPKASDLLPYLNEIDKNSYYTNFGPLVRKFEHRLEAFQNQHLNQQINAVTVSSATMGIFILLKALELPAKSRVMIPSFTFAATASAVCAAGHIPVVTDVDKLSWLLTPKIALETIEKKFKTSKPSAIIPVSCFGFVQDANEWAKFSVDTGLKVIIDAAGAFGGQMVDENVPSVFSLHATKALSCGEGGVIATTSKSLSKQIRELSNFGFGINTNQLGFNGKLSEYAAAVGNADLERFFETACQRRKMFEYYRQQIDLRLVNEITYQQGSKPFAPTIFCVKASSPEMRVRIEEKCAKNRIETRRWYTPLVQNLKNIRCCEMPIVTTFANELEQTLIGLPFSLNLAEDEVDRVIEAIKDAL